MVIYVVKNASRPVFGESSPVPDGKRFTFLCGLYCNSERAVMQVVSARVAAQQLRRHRQRIVSRLRSLRAKLTFPQQLSHSRNLRCILRESISLSPQIHFSRRSSIVQPRTFARLRTVSALALLMSLLRCSYIWIERRLTLLRLASSACVQP